jgi:SMI1-KNR4 cell-wall
MRLPFKSIARLLPPPRSPHGLDRSWRAVEKELGLALPADYKEFIDAYGTGQISSAAGWAVVRNFRDTGLFGRPLRDILCGEGSVIGCYERLEKESNYPCPYPTYPDPGGLLPFGSVVDVQNLNWLTQGAPNRWEVVYWHFDGLEFTHLKGDPFGRCLLKMLRQEYVGLERPSSLEPPFEFTELRG